MAKPSQPKNLCPACGGTDVVRVDPSSLNFAQASHHCESCGVKLSSHLKWSKAASELGIGLLLLVLGLAAYEASKQLPAITPSVRFVALLAFMGGAFGFSARRVIKAIEFEPWVPKP